MAGDERGTEPEAAGKEGASEIVVGELVIRTIVCSRCGKSVTGHEGRHYTVCTNDNNDLFRRGEGILCGDCLVEEIKYKEPEEEPSGSNEEAEEEGAAGGALGGEDGNQPGEGSEEVSTQEPE